MRISKVTSDDTKVTVKIHCGDNAPPSTMIIDVSCGLLRVTADINNRMVCLVDDGKVRSQPFDHNKMNVIESELVSVLRLFREIHYEGKD